MPRPSTAPHTPEARLRAELVALLRGGNAHVPTSDALAGIPYDRIHERPAGLPYSIWELVYHLWFAQHDILVFVQNPDYQRHAWPDDYWPAEAATPEAWADTRQAFLSDLDRLVGLVENEEHDLTAELGHAPGYTLFRQVLLAADHNAHHLGQLLILRRLLGLWPPDRTA
jgi:hypothetical protein